MTASTAFGLNDLGPLLRGDVEIIAEWIERGPIRRTWSQVFMILIGAGAFGAAIGWWRDPMQALYSGVKLPLILLFTAGGNSLINGMLASLLGLNCSLRQSFAAVLMSFSLAAAILGAFSPIMLFLVWNFPPLVPGAAVTPTVYAAMLLTLVLVIAFAGITANVRLFKLLRKLGGSSATAWRLLFAWLSVNLLLGSQLSYNLRPFIGAPLLPVQFLRPNPFDGNFFEAVWRMILTLLQMD